MIEKLYTVEEVAELASVTGRTIRNYLSTILDKLNLRDRTQLAIFYLTAKNAS